MVELGIRDLSATVAIIARENRVANLKQNAKDDRVEPIIPVSLSGVREIRPIISE